MRRSDMAETGLDSVQMVGQRRAGEVRTYIPTCVRYGYMYVGSTIRGTYTV